MKVCKELIQRESRYSIHSVQVNPQNRFWNQIQINIIAESLYKRGLTVENRIHKTKIIIGNQTIIDMVIDYIDQLGVNNKKRIKWLYDLNRVHLYKRLLLPFELIGIDRRQTSNSYQNKDEISSIAQVEYQYENNKPILR